jgi:FkbM family methyltransferase
MFMIPGLKATQRAFCLAQSLKKFGVEPRGIIHVGMADPRWIDRHLNAGFQSILVVEADPLCFQRLASQPARTGVCIVHAAAADFNGTVYLNRTELAGCSSLLEFHRHREIYPNLAPTDRVQVPARTLDQLLEELRLEPSHYNALYLDAQGAELMVLAGAGSVLNHAELVCLSVYRDEIYKGVPRQDAVDEKFQAAGYQCAALRHPWHETIGQAVYLRRRVLSMSSLGTNGKFADQLFQYLYLRIAALVQGMCLQIPDWIGREIYDLDEPPVTAQITQVLIDDAVKVPPEWSVFPQPERLITGGRIPLQNTDAWGYFQFNTRVYKPYVDLIRSLYTPKGEIAGRFSDAWERVRRSGKKVIGVHLRRGDYGEGIFFRAPCSWYENWVRENQFDPTEYVIYVSSEDASVYANRFSGYQVLTAVDTGLVGVVDEALLDFHMLCQSDVLAISNSSFSFMASLLNTRCHRFVRPDPELRALQSFAPWDSEPLIRTEISPEEHRAMVLAD